MATFKTIPVDLYKPKAPYISWSADDKFLYPRNELIITAGRRSVLDTLEAIPLPYAVFFGALIFAFGMMVGWAALRHEQAVKATKKNDSSEYLKAKDDE